MRMASMPLLLDKVGLSSEQWSTLLNQTAVPLMMLRANSEMYFEVEAVGRILAGTSSGQSWLNFIARHQLRRKLTKAEKIKVAASQKWRCMRCQELLDECFEVDHVEQHCLRGDDSSSNVQALCPRCHRRKTNDDLYISNPYFGVASIKRLQSDERKRATHKSIEKESTEPKMGVRDRPSTALPFSKFRRTETFLDRQQDDA